MPAIYDCSQTEQLLTGTRLAREALVRGELVVIPTDTVYGLAADAFNPAAVQRLLDAKGRGRQSPPPVFVPDTATLNALAVRIPGGVHQLTPRMWPGALTIVLLAQPSLQWDLGDSEGTVAVRMPNNPLVLELLRETGPLAVSSANTAGLPAARTAAEAAELLGDAVAVYLDGGELSAARDEEGAELRSTILDATGAAGKGVFRILRRGLVSEEELRRELGDDAVIDASAGADAPPGAETALEESGTVADEAHRREGSPLCAVRGANPGSSAL